MDITENQGLVPTLFSTNICSFQLDRIVHRTLESNHCSLRISCLFLQDHFSKEHKMTINLKYIGRFQVIYFLTIRYFISDV